MTNAFAMNAPERAIIQNIQAEAKDRAQRILDAARAAADAETTKARQEGDALYQDLIARAQEKAARTQARELATAHIEAKRILLRAREESVNYVVERLTEALNAIRKDPVRYRESLLRLAVEAILGIGGTEVHLAFGPGDRALADSGFAAELNARLHPQPGASLAVEFQVADQDFGGGCIAQSPDGRIVFDNSFPARRQRSSRALRAAIVKETVADHV